MLQDSFDAIDTVWEGATSVVVRATRRSDRRRFVIKILRPHLARDVRALQEFRTEFDLGLELQSPRVVRPLEWLEGAEPAILYPDLGTDLGLRVADGAMDVPTALQIGISAARALADVHAAGLIHRDVTPSNLVRSEEGVVRLIDLGLARRRSRSEPEGGRLRGTFAYIAPEQTGRTNRSVDERADLYGLGATLYHLLTGKPPFTAPDRLGLIHAHLARPPREPHRVRTEIPTAASRIVSHALRKSPDERYQTAFGMAHDLELVAAALERGESLEAFVPGQNDRHVTVRLTEELVGREKELETLRDTLEKGIRGVVCVRGWSGIGKTRLVMELRPDVEKRGGVWIAGKHELLGRGVPYAGLARALSDWARRVAAVEEEGAALGQVLRMALGHDVGALVSVVPELQLLVGETPKVTPLTPAEAERRLAALFGIFFGALARPGAPLVLFVDDLQWADTGSLEVLSKLALSPEVRGLVIAVAWRDNEVTTGHPVLTFLQELRAKGGQVLDIEVRPLTREATAEFLARSLRQSASSLAGLSEAIFSASGGSPFYIGRLLNALNDTGGLSSGPDGWTWRADSEVLREAPDDAAAFVGRRMEALSDGARTALATAAWLGSRFSLSDVAAVMSTSLGEAAARIHEAEALEAILRVDDSPVVLSSITIDSDQTLLPEWRFTHDRVQQAASELVDEVSAATLRLALAKRLSAEGGLRRFEAIDHAVAAERAGVTGRWTPPERLGYVRLAAEAGRGAINAASFDVALSAFEAGLRWGGSPLWATEPALASELSLGAAEAAYLNADLAAMERHVTELRRRVADPLTVLRAEEIAASSLMAANELDACIDRGINAVNASGLDIPLHPGQPQVVMALLRTKFALRRFTPEQIAELPLCSDPLVLARSRLVNNLLAAAWYGRQPLYPVMVFSLLRGSIAHGVYPETPPSMITYGIVLNTLGAVDEAIRYGKAALRLNDRLSDRRLRNRSLHLYNAHIRFWFERWHLCRDELARIHRACWEGGDVEFAAFAAFMSAALGVHTGEPLITLQERGAQLIAAIRSLGQQTMLHTSLLHHQLVENLLGLSTDPTRLVGAEYDEFEMEAHHRRTNDKINLHCLGVARAALACFTGRFDTAAHAMRSIDAWERDARSQPLHHVGTFFDALAHAAQGDLRRARKKLAVLRKSQHYGPMNFSHRVALVEAEIEASSGRWDKACGAWDRAISAAAEHGYPHELALAHDRAGARSQERGHLVAALLHIREAREGYAQWGAAARVQQLDAQLRALDSGLPWSRGQAGRAGFLLPGKPGSAGAPPRELPTGPALRHTESFTVDTSDSPLDLEGLLSAARRVSQGTDKATITSALLESALILAGATHATLFRVTPAGLRRELVARTGTEGVEVTEDSELGQSPIVESAASQLICLRPRGDADDWCLGDRNPLSVLVIPVALRGETTAMLTVEHAELADAFPPARVEPLEALAAQAAIAFENAVHYEELDAKVRDRTSELLAARLEAERERERADKLLMNVLPEAIALELKRTGRAAPVSVESATVLFTDFAGFTELAARMAPEELVAQLERCFAAYDDIVDRHRITKLKTIGDAYMAVGGLPVPTADHAFDVVCAGLEMAAWVAQPTDGGAPIPFRVRVGVHTGPLVAGVIGKRRFLYDVWGDAVNTAARMESSGQPGRVNLSRVTWELVRDRIACTPRGLVAAKGKGELEMYFADAVLGR